MLFVFQVVLSGEFYSYKKNTSLGGREEEEETRELKAEMKGKPKEQEKRGQKDV